MICAANLSRVSGKERCVLRTQLDFEACIVGCLLPRSPEQLMCNCNLSCILYGTNKKTEKKWSCRTGQSKIVGQQKEKGR